MNIKEELHEKSQNTNGEIFNFFFKSKALSYKALLKSFNEEIFQKYNQVDFAITRSGASTISELIFFNIPFLAIPLPKSKDNHQFYNARDYFKVLLLNPFK